MAEVPPTEPPPSSEGELSNEAAQFPGFRSSPMIDKFYHHHEKDDPPAFEFGEHSYLGDGIVLQWDDGRSYTALEKPLTLPNNLTLTYGQINALAGDFYGTDRPISDGSNPEDQKGRFVDAFRTLAAEDRRAPTEAKKIVKILDDEVKAIKEALDKKTDPSVLYNELPDHTIALEYETRGRPNHGLSYLELSAINWDHFGHDARITYVAGHSVALEAAKDGNLQLAYAMNAFADHFLEDSFSSGHLRTPRRALHNTQLTYDICAKFMHDEDNAIGLSVKNANGDSWKIYGDKRLLDKVDNRNHEICKQAVQASADEVYAAWKNKAVPDRSQYAVLKLVPDLDAVQTGQELAALFKMQSSKLVRRSNLKDRRKADYIDNWDSPRTIFQIKLSGWWDYPITIDGPKH